jgi:hypothetical protein
MKEVFPYIVYPWEFYDIVIREPNLPKPPQKPIKPKFPGESEKRIKEYRKENIYAFLILAFLVSAFNKLNLEWRLFLFLFVFGTTMLIFFIKIYPKKKHEFESDVLKYNESAIYYEEKMNLYKQDLLKHEQKIKNLTSEEAIIRFRKIERFKMRTFPPKQLLEKDPFYESRKKKRKGISHDFFCKHSVNSVLISNKNNVLL